jgi:hypothetical protein
MSGEAARWANSGEHAGQLVSTVTLAVRPL